MSVIIRLKNLPISAGASDVRSFFSGLKIPDGAVHIIGGDEGEVFVGFASDDDARIAMTKDRLMIHGEEIRLLLSSKSEQNSVIAARKNGTYTASPQQDEYVPSSTSQHQNHIWPPPEQQSSNPYAANSGYEASYPPQNSTNRVEFQGNQNTYNNRTEGNQNAQPSPKKDSFGGLSFKPNFQQPPPEISRFGQPAQQPPQRPTDPLIQRPPPAAHHQPPPSNRYSPERNYGYNKGGNNNEASRREDVRAPGNGRVQGGDSWRDSSYAPEPKTEFKDEYKSGFESEYRNDRDFNGSKNFNAHPPAQQPSEPPFHSLPNTRAPHQPTARRTLMPTPGTAPAPFQNGAPAFQNGPSPFQNGPANFSSEVNRPFQNGPVPVRNGPAPFQNGPPSSIPVIPAVNQATIGNSVPPFQNSVPPVVKPVFNQPPTNAAPAATPVPEKFYIEMARLPTDLLRPSSLEAFIRPTTPLTLSSVKTVFGPGGIHMHTIIRLDSIADYATMMRRNGEQGIKIQQSDRKTFEAAVDGIPVPAVAVPVVENTSRKRDEDDGKKSRRSRWENKSPHRTSPKRRSDHRDRERSRSPPRRRRRSRSPKRRDEHTDPTRWCVQVTNVPFRMKEEELQEWFAEKVRPAKLTRTYYSDGNASDRWIAEFSSESLMRRSFAIRTLCANRTLRLTYIDNEKADEILKIEDVYGLEKKNINEEARMMKEESEKNNPPSFFNTPSTNRPSIPPVNSAAGLPPPSMFNAPPMRGGFMPQRGGMFNPPAPRGGMMGRGNPFPPTPFFPSAFNGPDNFRGGFRGGFAGGGRGRGAFPIPSRGEDIQPSRNEFLDLVKSLGSPGTVLSCNGFPKDVTLEDVMDFFDGYEPDRNSIRIRRADDGVMTGECMLSCLSPENARRASQDLNGQKLRNSAISVRVV